MAEEKKKEKKVDVLPKDEEQTLLALIDKQITEHPVVTQWFDKWKELIDWTDLGRQFYEWKGGTSRKVPLKKRKKLVVVNQMKPLAEAIEGKISMIHSLVGYPNSGEVEDIGAAKVATKLIAHNDYINKVESLFEDMKYDLIRTGNSWVKIVWDKGVEGRIKDDNGGSQPQSGEVVMSVPSVFNIRPDPTAKSREEMRWIVELAEVTYDDIMEEFDVKKEDLDAAIGSSGMGADKYKGTNEKMEDKDPDEKTAIVKYYWERKTTKYSKGRHFIVVGDLFLWKGINPELAEIPFFPFGYKRYANSLWHTGPMFHVQGLQREYNRTISMISEHIEAWKPKMAVPPGSVMKDGAFTTDSFELLEVDNTKGNITPVNMPELSGQVMAYRDFIDISFGKVSNVHEVSYAQLPKYASRAPASLFSMMLEQENVKIDPMIKRMNQTLVDMGNFRLRLMDKFYKQERLVKVAGKSNQGIIEYFSGADLKGNFDVKLDIGISLHQSKVVQQRLLIELRQTGILKEEDDNKILKLLNEGDISEEMRGDIVDETRAIRENQAFANDTYDKEPDKGGVKIYVHDNDDVHMGYHTNLRKSEEAQSWPQKRLDALDEHVQEHFTKIQMLRMMQMQMATQTAGGGGGGAGATSTPATSPLATGGGGSPGPSPGGSPAGGGQATNIQ